MAEVRLMREGIAELARELEAHAVQRGAELDLTMMDLVAILDGLQLHFHQLINAHIMATVAKKKRDGLWVPGMPDIRLRGGDNGKGGP